MNNIKRGFFHIFIQFVVNYVFLKPAVCYLYYCHQQLGCKTLCNDSPLSIFLWLFFLMIPHRFFLNIEIHSKLFFLND